MREGKTVEMSGQGVGYDGVLGHQVGQRPTIDLGE